MKFVEAIRRLIATSWLVAAPLVIVFGFIAIVILFSIVQTVVEHVFGAETADDFARLWFGALMWGAELTLLFAPIALIIWAIVLVARRLARNRKP